MSRFRTIFLLQMARDEAHILCSCAIADSGFVVTDETEARIICREKPHDVTLTENPVRLAVSFDADARGPTQVTINGANFGAGPIQWGHVRAQVECLLHVIELRAARSLCDQRRGEDVRNVLVNHSRLSDAMVAAMEQELGRLIPDGAYWYDRVSGAWGVQGGPTLCLIRPNLIVGGPVRADASNGTTGVFVNDRELDDQDAATLGSLIALAPGRYWVDAHGDFGPEGGPRSGNLVALARICPVPPSGSRRAGHRPLGVARHSIHETTGRALKTAPVS